MIDVNWLAVVVCGVAAMMLGMIWHSQALFGTMYMKAIGGDMNMPPEKMKEIQKKMWQLYITQFILSLLTAYVLFYYIVGAIDSISALSNALWIWLGFIMPTIAGQWMWSARPRNDAWTGFLISAGYSLALFVIFAVIIKAMM